MRTDLSCPMRDALSESGGLEEQAAGQDVLAENRNRPTRAVGRRVGRRLGSAGHQRSGGGRPLTNQRERGLVSRVNVKGRCE
jgi:hypothetical protein